MRRTLGSCTLLVAAAVTMFEHPGHAQSAAQFYPYCALSAASGATTCYFRSREECGTSCISNPGYIGMDRAEAHARRRHEVRDLPRGPSRFQP
jgi:hypothetical protein